jgi:hypothetical protein
MTARSPFPPLGAAVLPPGALPLARAIEGSAALARLTQRLQQSRTRLEAVLPALPATLRTQVRAGPCDDRQWVLLAASAAAAAKLRQCLPDLHQRLAAAGWPAIEIRVRVGSRESAPPPPAAPSARHRHPE